MSHWKKLAAAFAGTAMLAGCEDRTPQNLPLHHVAGPNTQDIIVAHRNGTWTLTLDGIRHTFTDSDAMTTFEVFGDEGTGQDEIVLYQSQDAHLFCWVCDFREVSESDPEHPAPHFALLAGTGPWNEFGGSVLVIGHPTLDFGGMGDANATYGGGVGTIIMDNGNGRDVWDSLAVLTADFANSTISGRLYGFVGTYPDYNSPPPFDVLTLPPTRFTTEGFSGQFEPSCLEAGDHFTASYEGSLYGPNADSVAGTIIGTGVFNGVRVRAWGGFQGWQHLAISLE
ncbi:MAG: transferrin-binding protein-like solute binding protein [Boseongicola sp. SB0670_bin_30]|nr:transferrin-binding protein-like solute binding protein [Boseongicola sp. SB0670_bin_30]